MLHTIGLFLASLNCFFSTHWSIWLENLCFWAFKSTILACAKSSTYEQRGNEDFGQRVLITDCMCQTQIDYPLTSSCADRSLTE